MRPSGYRHRAARETERVAVKFRRGVFTGRLQAPNTCPPPGPGRSRCVAGHK